MKALKIESHKGLFVTEDGSYETIEKLDKAALLTLVNLALDDDFEIDKFDEEVLKNQAHQIIYKSISEKLTDLNIKRKQFRDESERLYLDAYEKYNKVTGHSHPDQSRDGTPTPLTDQETGHPGARQKNRHSS